MRSSSRVRWLLAAGFTVALGCGDTAIVVEIRSDGLSIPDELDAVCLAAWDADPAGGAFGQLYPLDADNGLPQSLTVEPGDARRAELVARGYRDGREVARVRDFASFHGVDTAVLSLTGCAPGSADPPTEAGTVKVPPGTRAAVSFGRGGTVVVAVGPSTSKVFRAATDSFEDARVSSPAVSATMGPRELVAFDADGDCDDDVLLVPLSAPPALWRREDAGSFSNVEGAVPAVLGPARAAAVADVDGDTDVDIALETDSQLVILLNDGTGQFTQSANVIAGDAGMDLTAVAPGDLDGDGDPDLVAARGSGQPEVPRALFNTGDGAFVDVAQAVPQVPLLARQVEIADLTGDGLLDVLLGVSASHVYLYANLEDGRLEDRSDAALPSLDPIEPSATSVGDWDGDCLNDVAVGLADGSNALLWRGSNAGTLASEPFSATATEGAQLVDVNDDGARDLLIVDTTEGLSWTRR